MFAPLAILTASLTASSPVSTGHGIEAPVRVLFEDDFEHDLSKWILEGRDALSIHQAVPGHGGVLRLRSNGDVHALIRGSGEWSGVSIEGEVLFVEGVDSYLGLAYNFRRRGARTDFGLIYLKHGRRTYLQPNPHRDYNVTRKFYPEYQAPLSGPFGTRTGEWQTFRMEVIDGVSHVYVGDTVTPQLTFPIAEPGPGLFGFQPRSVGGDVWLDNIRVSSIDRFSYSGPAQPAPIAPDPSSLRFELLGPFPSTCDAMALSDPSADWRPFQLDPRGAVETARVIDYHGSNTVAYFRTVVIAGAAGPATLSLSTVDDLALWLNGRFQGFVQKQERAWPDYVSNPEHKGAEVSLSLRPGANLIVIRARGGTYAGGGFYAALAMNEGVAAGGRGAPRSGSAARAGTPEVQPESRSPGLRLREQDSSGAGQPQHSLSEQL